MPEESRPRSPPPPPVDVEALDGHAGGADADDAAVPGAEQRGPAVADQRERSIDQEIAG